MFRRVIVLFLAVFLLASTVQAGELVISAAASLTDAFKEMQAPFEKAHPGTTLVFNFAASGPLLKQIEQGAPVDVFASADQDTMDKAAPHIVAASRVNFVGNALVLIAPTKNEAKISGLQDLGNDAVKLIAVGNPESVPVGRYTKGALEKAELYAKLAPKFVLAESVRQALDYVTRSEVQAGFVYATDAAVRKDDVAVVAEIPGTKPIIYPIAVLQASKNSALAQSFVDFVCGADGQAILAKYGFKKP